jgi:hypothetical protein
MEITPKKAELLTGLTCVLKENYKYAQKQNLEVKQIFVETLIQYLIKSL